MWVWAWVCSMGWYWVLGGQDNKFGKDSVGSPLNLEYIDPSDPEWVGSDTGWGFDEDKSGLTPIQI